ncbi:MAG: hypothetical protein ACR2NX_13165, partial [Chthoniobacterales bacterium]
ERVDKAGAAGSDEARARHDGWGREAHELAACSTRERLQRKPRTLFLPHRPLGGLELHSSMARARSLKLEAQFAESAKLEAAIRRNLPQFDFHR